ncbi:DNA polymerase III subunit chi [Saccharibacter sp. 17.LH.SD]|uniref:DNA polymerase III subunit chi n=1 Tax=Saccharibacter sp. 17.LH.SD TaxID=2689393 RepID=UPI00136AF5CF|nr:DNA polymerase III subunit chi [Saccharibacter sp. 17.LH.SD]MXV44769.1 DNA polymerase III subunit chi [Saccharibacter sp. 17.LH.SD]
MAAETHDRGDDGAEDSLAEKRVQVGFYHLTRTSLDEALPALLGKTLDARERAVVRCSDDAMVAHLDKVLWACRSPIWLPHGCAATGKAERQPIWLTAESDVPNQAQFLFRINGAGDDVMTSFVRVFDLFDGRDEHMVEQARVRWRAMKKAGCLMTYWKQEARGWRRAG